MRSLVDAQLPQRLAYRLRDEGHNAVHTLDLPNGNRTSDAEINAISDRDGRVVVTKDADFVDSLLLSREPRKLLLVSIGNASNAELEAPIVPRIREIAVNLSAYDYVELTRTAIIAHT